MKQRKQPTIGTTAFHWFGRGLMSGVILVAAGNALSYFFRTPSISDLIGKDENVTEAIGFPFEIWEENKIYGSGYYIDYPNAGFNLLIGLAIGAVLGLIAVTLRKYFNRWVEEFEQKNSGEQSANMQFSIKGLLVITTLASLLLAAMTRWNGTPEVLMAIYFLGPLLLIGIAMAPNRIRWQHRVVILSIMALAMIGIALSSGNSLNVPLDRVLLGIFVSWTPQSAFGAFLLTLGLIVQIFWRSGNKEKVQIADID
ncbi:MAG: hypothetical protein AB8B55_11400 [Mariniblastus sp.]